MLDESAQSCVLPPPVDHPPRWRATGQALPVLQLLTLPSVMAVDVTGEQALRRKSRLSQGWLALVTVLVGCSFVMLLIRMHPTPGANTPTRAVDLYVTAREHGDRGAMADILDGNADLRTQRLSDVDSRPVNVTSVSMTRSTVSETLYDVTVSWTDGTHAASTDRLLVLPRPDDPSASPAWSVSVAP